MGARERTAVTDLHIGLNPRPAPTVFHLLGKDEDDLTRALSWTLSRSERFLAQLLADLKLPFATSDVHRLRVQHAIKTRGRTDIEIEVGDALVIIEAKLGWNLPSPLQMRTYERRIRAAIADHVAADLGVPVRYGGLVTLSECSPEWAAMKLPETAGGLPTRHLTWARMSEDAERLAGDGGPLHERRLLREFADYLRSTTTMRDDPASQMTWVVPVSRGGVRSSSLNFIETVRAGHYYNRITKVPKGAFNFIGFRWASELREIRYVEARELFTDPHAAMPELFAESDDAWDEHEYFKLGPAIIPLKRVPYGKLYAPGHHRALLDCLLTSDTVAEARDRSRARFAAARIPF